MATSGGLAKVAALIERLGSAKGEPLGPDPPWKPRDPLVERLFAKEIFGKVSDRKRKLSENPEHGEELETGTVGQDKVDEQKLPRLGFLNIFIAPGLP